MKRKAVAVILGSLFAATQAIAATNTAWPEGADDWYDSLPAAHTYADTHAVDRVTRGGSAFPAGAWDLGYGMPLSDSYAGRHVSEANTPFTTIEPSVASADDPDDELPARNTYADQHQYQPVSAE